MASNSQKTPTTKRNKKKALTLENFYKEKIQSTEETGEEGKQETLHKTAPAPQNDKCSQAFLEIQSKVMRMEEIWKEKWKTAQNRILQLETEAQKSNEMMKARNEQLEAMTAENQSLKTRIEQLEANRHKTLQE